MKQKILTRFSLMQSCSTDDASLNYYRNSTKNTLLDKNKQATYSGYAAGKQEITNLYKIIVNEIFEKIN